MQILRTARVPSTNIGQQLKNKSKHFEKLNPFKIPSKRHQQLAVPFDVFFDIVLAWVWK